ncbi:MAG: MDR family MFS transporter [Candidatus Nanoperiomorbaceae bacterium]
MSFFNLKHGQKMANASKVKVVAASARRAKVVAESTARRKFLDQAKKNSEAGLPLMNHLTDRRKIIIMLAVMAATFLVALDSTVMSTAIGRIANDFNAFSSYSWLLTSYLLTFTIAIPISGKLSDLFGRKPMVLFGVIVFVLGSLGSAMSGNVVWLIVWRAVQGLGGGVIMANSFTIIGDLFTPRERGRWQGLISASFGLASVAGPLIGGFFADAGKILGIVGWRWSFLVNVPIGLAVIVLITVLVPFLKHAKHVKIDFAGAIAITIAIAALVFATDSANKTFSFLLNHGWSINAIEWILWAIVAVATGLFVWFEHRASDPIIPNRFWGNRTYMASMIAWLFFGAAMMSFILYITQFNQQVFGAGATESGLMLLPAIGALSITAAISGSIVTKTGRYKIMMVAGFAMLTTSAFFATTLNSQSSFWYESVWQIVAGIGLGMSMPTLNLAVQNAFRQKDLGVATSSSQLFRSLGQTIGTAVLGSMMTAGVAVLIGSVPHMPFVHDLQTISQSGANKSISNLMDNSTIDADLAMNLTSTIKASDVNKMANGTKQGVMKIDDAISAAQQQALIGMADGMRINISQIPSSVQDQIRTTVRQQVIDQANGKSKLTYAQLQQLSQNIRGDYDKFHKQVVDAFTKELARIFYIVTILSLIGAIIIVFGVKEHRLRGPIEGTPGEDTKAAK